VNARLLSFDIDRYIGNHPHYEHYHKRHAVVLLVDMDAALQIAMECVSEYHGLTMRDRMRQVYGKHAAKSKDGVFAFEGFKRMMLQAVPGCSDSVIMTVFREALIKGG